MSSGGENASINLICDPDGTVRFQSLSATPGDDWASGDAVAPHVGKLLVKTYWFDHLDCDQRELLQVLKKAGAGSSERARVWMRVDEHQLIRVELTATPMTDASGQMRSVLIRTETAGHTRRKRDAGEPETKRLTQTSAPDLLRIRLSIPMLRVQLASGTVSGCNDATLDLLLRSREAFVGLPLSEFVAESDRRPLIELLAALQNASETIRTIDLALLNQGGEPMSARLSLTPDPSDAEPSALVVIRDLSADTLTQELLRRADAITSVMARTGERLAQLDAFFDHAPLGLALLHDGEIVRANPAFEAHRDEYLSQLAKNGEATPGRRVIPFRAGPGDDALLAVIAPQESPTAIPAPLAALIDSSPHLLMVRVDADQSLRPLAGKLRGFAPLPDSPGALFEDDARATVETALQAVRGGSSVDPFDARLIDRRPVRVSVAPSDASGAWLFLEDLSERVEERERLQSQVQEQAETIAELAARSRAIDPAQLSAATSLAADRGEQLASLVSTLGAGTFTWDVTSGHVNADPRAIELLASSGENLTINTLLAAATFDERRAFEQRYFDAASGDRHVDLLIHVGPERRAARIVGHVLVDERDGSTDPRALVAIVIDQAEGQPAGAHVKALERQLAIRSAELNAILESSREAIRINTGGTLRHNAAAAELFGDDINALLDAPGGVVSHRDRPIQASSTPVRVGDEAVGVVSVASDQSESALLRRREAEIAAIFANTGIAVAILDDHGAFHEVNSSLCSLLGQPPALLVGKPLADFVLADDRPTLQSEFDAVNSGELQSCTSDVRLLRRDGDTNWVHLTVTRPADGSRSTIVLLQDIQELRDLRTLRDELKRDLDDARTEQTLLASTAQEAILRLRPDGTILDANLAAQRLLALEGRPTLSHLSFVAPETGNAVRDQLPWARAKPDRTSVVELRVTTPDDRTFVGRFSSRADEHGNIALGVADVTRVHSMQEELQKAYARIVESHTLLQQRTQQLEGNFVSAVQQLGASIASAYGTAKALRGDSRLPRPLFELGQRVVDAFRVHRRLVQYYMASSAGARSPSTEESVDVHELANQAATALGERFNITGRLELSLAAPQHHCRLDSAMARHALWSIFAHAVSQATKQTARVSSSSLASTRGGGKLRIAVEWPGSRAGTAELHLADALITSCGGTFSISQGADSSSANIEFDLDTAQPGEDQTSPRQRRHVLLIEDHESTSRVLRRQLERLGCDVSHATNLAEARGMLEDRADIDLLICDLSLPDDDAHAALADLLTRLDTPAIALRSYGGVEAPEELLSLGFVDHIDKPVDLTALSAVIARFAAEPGV